MQKDVNIKINQEQNTLGFLLKNPICSIGEKLYSFKDMDIEINGDILDKERFKNTLGNYMSYKPNFKRTFYNTPKTNIEIIISLFKPLYIDEFIFDGGKDSRFYNSTILKDIQCLNINFWEKPNNYTKYNKVKIHLENSNTRSMLDNIINSMKLNFKNDGLILNREYLIKDYTKQYNSIIGNEFGGMDLSEPNDNLKYFLVKYKNKFNNRISENLILSYSDKPILRDNDEIIEYKFI